MLHGLLVDLIPVSRQHDERRLSFWNNESRLWADVGNNTPLSRAQFKQMADNTEEEPGYSETHFTIRAKDGCIIGTISMWTIFPHRVSWIGAWIGDPAYWGGGHGTDSLLLLTEYAFRWLDLHRLTLITMAINERAQRNAEKCGFTREAVHRKCVYINGGWMDEIQYGLLANDWPGRNFYVEQLRLRDKAIQRYGK